MKNNIDEIVLDEQKKADEQSKKKMPKEKVKRVVLAVLLLILAVAFVVLGAFCATGFIDVLSAPAVASATYEFDNSNDYFNLDARQYFGVDAVNVTPAFNAFLIVDNFSSWFDDWFVPTTVSSKSFITFYNNVTHRKVADLLLDCGDTNTCTISLRVFANDKLSSYSTLKMFDCYASADDNGALVDTSVRTFTDTYCFGYNASDMVYAKLNDDVVNELWAIEFTEMLFLCTDVSNSSKINCISYIPYYPSTGTYGERVYIDTDYLDENTFVWSCKSKIFPTDIKSTSDFVSDNVGIYNLSYEGLCRKIINNYYRNQTWYYLDDDGYYHFEVLVYAGERELFSPDYDTNRFIFTDVILPSGNDVTWGCAYDKGYGVGHSQALSDTDTVVNGVIDVIESPVEFLKTVFNFEIFGINISSVIFFVISVVIVAFVIKKVV